MYVTYTSGECFYVYMDVYMDAHIRKSCRVPARECLYICVYVQHTHIYLYVCMYVCHRTTAKVYCSLVSTLSLLDIDVCVCACVCVCCVQFCISRYMKSPHSVALRQNLHRPVLCRYPIV